MNTVENTSPSTALQSPAKKIKTNASMSSYVLTTTESEKRALDLQVAAMMYATNTPFTWVEHAQVINLMKSASSWLYAPI